MCDQNYKEHRHILMLFWDRSLQIRLTHTQSHRDKNDKQHKEAVPSSNMMLVSVCLIWKLFSKKCNLLIEGM